MEPATHLVRRSRLRSFAAAAGHALHVDSLDARTLAERLASAAGLHFDEFEKRITPADLASIQAAESASLASVAAAAGSAAAAKASTTGSTSTSKAVAAQAATKGTTINTETLTSVDIPSYSASSTSTFHSTVVTTSWEGASSSAAASSISSIRSSSSSSAPASVTSAAHSSVTTSGVLTVTASASSSASPSASLSALQASTATKAVSTGGIVGIVIAVIVGLIVVGTGVAWFYRKHSKPWSSSDDDVTPFVNQEKDNDDFYGDASEAAPVIGSRRALALARQNAFNNDGTLRTDSVMLEREGNRAGLGAGSHEPFSYGSFPQAPMRAAYGVDAQGRPYNPEAGRVPMSHTIDEQYTRQSPPSSRQLLGPSHPYAADVPMPQPVPMGKPAAPDSYDDLTAHEEFGDLPETNVPKLMVPYDETEPYTPRTAVSANEWAGDARPLPPASLPNFDPLSPLMPTFTVSPPPVNQPLRLPQPAPQAQPYQHGQPLSPLTEVPTPLSTGPNPFEATRVGGSLAPPYSATTNTSYVPSPRFPPPSPGQMSVPGSVLDSPNWHQERGRPVSMTYSDEDAYGGI